MPVWNVTGKLGGGKTLFAVWMAFNYLREGRKVATNIDLFPETVLRPWDDSTRLIRVPDTPTREDLIALGIGNPSNDERRNGLLVLDECGGFLNARTFQDKGREGVLSFLRHTRKRGWDVILISQSYSMLDKQVREAVVEYLVRVRRFDRYKVPGLAALGIKVNMPRIHFAVSHYGTTPRDMVSERWFFRGTELFTAYSTRQGIESNDLVRDDGQDGSTGPYSVLTPWHLKGRYMKLSKMMAIVARSAVVGGFVFGVMVTITFGYLRGYERPKPVALAEQKVEQLGGYVINPDGTVTIIRKDGSQVTARNYTMTTRELRVPMADVIGVAKVMP